MGNRCLGWCKGQPVNLEGIDVNEAATATRNFSGVCSLCKKVFEHKVALREFSERERIKAERILTEFEHQEEVLRLKKEHVEEEKNAKASNLIKEKENLKFREEVAAKERVEKIRVIEAEKTKIQLQEQQQQSKHKRDMAMKQLERDMERERRQHERDMERERMQHERDMAREMRKHEKEIEQKKIHQNQQMLTLLREMNSMGFANESEDGSENIDGRRSMIKKMNTTMNSFRGITN